MTSFSRAESVTTRGPRQARENAHLFAQAETAFCQVSAFSQSNEAQAELEAAAGIHPDRDAIAR
jgi:hypothetical protein